MPKLLVVEDNAILAYTLARFLREQGDLTVAAVVALKRYRQTLD